VKAVANANKPMKILSQRDPRWAADKIGQSAWTVGQKGCALTSLINGANAIGANPKGLTPKGLAHNVALFLPTGDILWDKACAFIGPLRFAGREEGQNDARIVASLKDPDGFVILQVNYGAHFALAWSKSIHPLHRGDFVIADPWGGTKQYARGAYHNISGARYFVRR